MEIIKNKKGQEIDPVLFRTAFCNMCGSQRCAGIEDKDWREGCNFFNNYPDTTVTLPDDYYATTNTPTENNEIPSKVFTVDFDNTCTFEEFPYIGKNVPGAIEVLRKIVAAGHKVILWTMRRDDSLKRAVEWFNFHNIELWGVNDWPDKENIYIKEYGESRKVIGDYNIDDRNLGSPTYNYTDEETGKTYTCVDWFKINQLLTEKGLVPKKSLYCYKKS